ncbi:MAG: phosphoribosyltransferase [Acidimicrobiales bacterium]
MRQFQDRFDAGRQLAELVRPYATKDMVVLGLLHGGMPVAFEVALTLGLPLDALPIAKLGLPGQAELALGALGEDGVPVLNDALVRRLGIDAGTIRALTKSATAALESEAARMEDVRPALDLGAKKSLVVDDGIATGATIRAACRIARARGAHSVIIAVPVIAAQAAIQLKEVSDELLAKVTAERFAAVGEFYGDFTQVSCDEVRHLLARAARARDSRRGDPNPPSNSSHEPCELGGDLDTRS